MAVGLQKALPSESAFHFRAAKLRGSSCEACGATERLHAHHIDQDVSNNTPENIQTLCTSCHNRHHHRAKREGRAIAGRLEVIS